MFRILRTDVAFRILLSWLGGLAIFGALIGDLRWGVLAGLLSFPFLLIVLVASLFLGDHIAANPMESMIVVTAGLSLLDIIPIADGATPGTLYVSLPTVALFLAMNWKWRLPESWGWAAPPRRSLDCDDIGLIHSLRHSRAGGNP